MNNSNYWQNKISYFLHDPIDKVFNIQNHEKLAKEIADLLHQTYPSKEKYQVADVIASGLSRAALPGYSVSSTENGSIDFASNPVLTHPVVNNSNLKLSLPEDFDADILHRDFMAILKKDIGTEENFERLRALDDGVKPLNGFYDMHNSPEEWAEALFYYLFFCLKNRLGSENAGGIGSLWGVLPADSRMPDHSIWHHCALTSAIGSSLDAGDGENISIAVFSITPVQGFIAKARKLRDYWTASIILSYLAFIGIRTVMKEIGPDHVIYPSLNDQALVEAWIKKTYHLGRFLTSDPVIDELKSESSSIASFPNKFVFLCATSQVEELTGKIEENIQEEWLRLSNLVADDLSKRTNARSKLAEMFAYQASDFWQYSWSATRLLTLNDKDNISKIIDESRWKDEYDIVDSFSSRYLQSSVARLYQTTHSLAQSILASTKLKPVRIRKEQYGEKCPLCGENEVLHDFPDACKASAKEYSNAIKEFWDTMRNIYNSGKGHEQIGKNERLCSICTIKRFLPMVMKSGKHSDELLHEVFEAFDKFPSTTELAYHRLLKKLEVEKAISLSEKNDILQLLHDDDLHDEDEEKSELGKILAELKKKIDISNKDKYYAVLLMDGDKMGDLINGETISATWESAIHPELAERFRNIRGFASQSPLKKTLAINGEQKEILHLNRTINPSIHASISNALTSFSRFSVAPVIQKQGGILIYAGGDDVCAVLPLGSALVAAEELARAYRHTFVAYSKEGTRPIESANRLSGKISFHLGNAKGISISAAIVIAHHKEPLKAVIREAHIVLEEVAKKRTGRNAIAIRLKKRSGHKRDMAFKWDEPNIFSNSTATKLESFRRLSEHLAGNEISTRLLYRLESLRDAILPMAHTRNQLIENAENIVKLFAREIEHSDKTDSANSTPDMLARILVGICIVCPEQEDPQNWYNPEGVIIADFLAPSREDAR